MPRAMPDLHNLLFSQVPNSPWSLVPSRPKIVSVIVLQRDAPQKTFQGSRVEGLKLNMNESLP